MPQFNITAHVQPTEPDMDDMSRVGGGKPLALPAQKKPSQFTLPPSAKKKPMPTASGKATVKVAKPGAKDG